MTYCPATDDPELVTVIEATPPAPGVPLPKAHAHFFNGSKRKPAEVLLTNGADITRPWLVQTVSGRREARQIAKKYHAVCWNF